MPHFEVGGKVICIKSHSQGVVKRGDVRELLGIRKGCCKSNKLDLDIGITVSEINGRCGFCRDVSDNNGKHWLSSTLFAPYDQTLSDITAEELIESLELQLI